MTFRLDNEPHRKGETRSVLVPFDGFYHSVSSSYIDDAEERIFVDLSGEQNMGLWERAWEHFDYTAAQGYVAEVYLAHLSHELKMKLEFDCICSPQYYNFQTDRLFAWVREEDLRNMLFCVDGPGGDRHRCMDNMAKQMFESRSGFSSFYDHRWREWGDFEEWDHNQLGCLMAAYMDWYDQVPALPDLLYDAYSEIDSNGFLTDALIPEPMPEELERLFKIQAYLHEREEREIFKRFPPARASETA